MTTCVCTFVSILYIGQFTIQNSTPQEIFPFNMTSIIETHTPNETVLTLYSVTRLHDIFIKLLTGNVLLALQWEAVLARAVLQLHCNARGILAAVEDVATFARSKAPEVIVNRQSWERIDVRNAGEVRTVQQAGQKRSRKRKQGGRAAERRQQRERTSRREKDEQERLRKWEECWDKKITAEEERDRAECCAADGLCLKPRTQSNIWINVTQDRSLQEIHMTFKHVPVPRPKPPPLPPLRVQKTTVDVCEEEGAQVHKATNTRRRKYRK